MEIAIVGTLVLFVIVAVFSAIRSGTGKTVISKHDNLYAGLPPGALPPALDAPTRRATPDDVKTVVAVRFEPPTGVRPEQVGMLTTATVGATDVAAAVVALAVDGYIHLRRVEPEGRALWGRPKPGWLVTVNRGPDPTLGPFRTGLLEGLSALGRPATLTELKPLLGKAVPELRKAYAHDPQHHQWFPNLGKSFSRHGARERSALGSALRYQSAGFHMFLETADGNRLRFEAGAGMFSRYLPWAVAYGVTKEWVGAFQEAAAAADPGMMVLWAPDLAWFGDFGAFGDLDVGFDGFGEAMADFSDAIGDLGDSIGDFASDVGDAGGGDGGGGDGGGDGGGGD